MPESNGEAVRSDQHDTRIAWFLGMVAVAVELAVSGRYGYFRDELYYIAASNHLALGYVDFAPLCAWLLRGSRMLFGDSLHAIRLIPALAFGAEVALTGLITRELGGRRWAVLLACLSVLTAPCILANGNRFAMNGLEPLFWMGSVYFVLLAKNREQASLLPWAGLLLGLGLENKHSAAFFIAALVVGLLATSDRRLLAGKWFWIAAGIALAIALPNAIWQYQHNFPTLEDLRNVKLTHKNVELPPVPFLIQQIMMMSPVTALVWLPGLVFLLAGVKGKSYRSLGVTYLVLLGIMMALHGKDYYLAPIYPMLFAAGGVLWERLTSTRLLWLRVTLPVTVAVSGVITAPLVLPILPPDKIAPYMQALHVQNQKTETGMQSLFPQHFADQFGWQEMVQTVAGVYWSLPPDERAKTAIFANNYGEAGAIDFFGPRYGLPKSISGHQNYYYWGPRQYTGESMILLEWSPERAHEWCNSVEVGPKIDPYYGMSWERYNVLICRGFKEPLSEAWPEFKFWN